IRTPPERLRVVTRSLTGRKPLWEHRRTGVGSDADGAARWEGCDVATIAPAAVGGPRRRGPGQVDGPGGEGEGRGSRGEAASEDDYREPGGAGVTPAGRRAGRSLQLAA